MAIVDRIRKLVALSKSDNVNEASQAAAMAQRLMLEHKIEMADLELAGAEVKVEEVVEDTVEGNAFQNGRREQWRINLAARLAEAFNAKIYFTYGTKHIAVIGHKSDCQTVQYLQQYFGLEITRLCEAAWREVKAQAKAAQEEDGFERELPRATVWKNSFRDGAVHAIGARMKRERDKNLLRTGGTINNEKYVEELQAEIVAEAAAEGAPTLVATSQAMVLVREQEKQAQSRVNSFWDARFTKPNGRSKLRSSRHSYRKHSHDGYGAGKAAGNSIPLSNAKAAIGGSKARLEG